MTESPPRSARFASRAFVYDWNAVRDALLAAPGQWITPLDEPISNGHISWLRMSGPVALQALRGNVEYRLKDGYYPEGSHTWYGMLHACYTPGAQPVVSRIVIPDETVREMRERYAEGDVTQAGLAEEYAVSTGFVNKILRGRTRREAGGPLPEEED